MQVKLASQLPEYAFIKVCLENILKSNYGENEKLFIRDLQVLYNYQNEHSLKDEHQLKNLENYLKKLEKTEKIFFLNELIKFIASLALKESELWNNTKSLKYLIAGQKDQLSLTKEEISILLANMFLLSTPRRLRFGQDQLPKCCPIICYEFVHSIQQGMAMNAKLRGIHNYFLRIYEKRDDKKYLSLKVDFQRQQFSEEMMKVNQNIVLGDIQIEEDKKIEEMKNEPSIHVDFANEYIGGGALFDGNVQEEILFNVCPELLVSMIFCQKMEEKESILIIGAEKFNNYTGYGSNFEVTGKYVDPTSVDVNHNRLNSYVSCIDAIPFGSVHEALRQYNTYEVQRELVKSLVAFQGPFENDPNSDKNLPVVTGNWGCGLFCGDPQVKLLIQWISCSLQGRKMVYCSFKHEKLYNQKQFICSLKGKSVKEILHHIEEYSKSDKKESFYKYLNKVGYGA